MQRETLYDPIFDSQEDFRVLLDAMSQPGSLKSLTKEGLHPPEDLFISSALIGFALLNKDVQFFHLPLYKDWQAYFTVNTNSQWTEAEVADFMFLQLNDGPEAIRKANKGVWTYPDQSASVIIQVAALATEGKEVGVILEMKGPGIPGVRQLNILKEGRANVEEMITALREVNAEYPLGVDVFWTDIAGNVVGMPRSCQFTLI